MRPMQYKCHWKDIPAIKPAKRDSPGDHLLVNGCMRTSAMEGGGGGGGERSDGGREGKKWHETSCEALKEKYTICFSQRMYLT